MGLGTSLNKIRTILQRIIDWQPLTFRGALVVLAAALGMKAYAIEADDLIVHVLAGTFLGLVAIVVLSAFALRFVLGRKLSAVAEFDRKEPLSRQDVAASLILHGSSLPPFFTVQVTRVFRHPGPISSDHIFRGRENGNARRLFDTVRFPHRGLWELEAIRFELRDSLGFCSLAWIRSNTASVEISAPTIPIRPLPVVAGSSRAGDELQFQRERLGDPFDMKPYDPTDGINRVLWKIYARTGELVVRRAEPAVIPEGEVAIYLVAQRPDDHVAGALQCYLDQLHRNNITVLFGTDGAVEQYSLSSSDSALMPAPEKSGAGLQHLHFFSDRAEIQQAINRSVWSSDIGSGKGFEDYLEALKGSQRSIHRVVVFVPRRRSDGWLERMGVVASKYFVHLTVVLVGDEIDPAKALELRKIIRPAHSSNLLQRIPGFGPIAKKNEGAELVAEITRAGADGMVCEAYE